MISTSSPWRFHLLARTSGAGSIPTASPTSRSCFSARIGAAARFFVFSDDLEWCRNELRWLPDHPVFVDHAFAGPKFSHYLHLMSMASHFVIPNSTFGWWAAWLSANAEKTVVAPK